MSKRTPARAGRPRDENVHRAILDAARDLISEAGYVAFSIEGVAARAGVAKQSIYRRWSSKGALLVDLYMDGLELPGSSVSQGFKDDLLALLLQTTKRVQDPAFANILKSVMVEAQAEPEMRELVLLKIVEPRREAARHVIERGIQSGEVPEEVDVEMMLDFVFGAVWFNLLFGASGLTNKFAHRAVKTIELLMTAR
ncbi:TetR/AcrR family transcriptional regulator [Bradyrhizobium elkanii]|uniref:AcrR family transcriptional regulator n=1 Tax=Bradyrhizobium elkanii TaxID=29448 RepID=A0ABV4EZ19_BRAEL|nr:TetR/AcrR family transcriptional regulator [Bradyrhizobium elkanii]MCP1757316.1 AcrR family transcriptional regulator [Bradyrhizobium elkanii]MCP1982829.1 AcrR family transcriptional regulator [Bradyrhizobium elkanii]MCS3691217.1 AcrR family transcriptional regulator [Bradyrhizobium elkanii]MCS3882387.1 AcrR family transcriptional regulator [Bradyrhizobium elkanii]MCS4219146.1 AcrR family transcriptional regulator [Bradyrhizobium elkanii]